MTSHPPKPRTERIRTYLTQLPALSPGRRFARILWKWVARLLAALFLQVKVHGRENIPRKGPVLVVSNHLGDADFILGLALSASLPDFIAKVELYDIPVIGKLLDAYGMIWIHRGQADRRALRIALDALADGRILSIAPEGRESVTGSLETGTNGAAYLALKAGVPIVPVTFTGTENKRIFPNLKRFRRTPVTFTAGPSFLLKEEEGSTRKADIERGTHTIMQTLAQQLPPEYRGVYQQEFEEA